MDLHLEKDHGVLDREKKDDPEKMQEKIKNIYKKKKATGYTRPLVTTDISTIYELPKPITYGSFVEKEFRQGEKEFLQGEKEFRQGGKENFQEGAESKPSVADVEKEKEKQQQNIMGKLMNITSIIPLQEVYNNIDSDFRNLAKVIGYNDIETNSLPPGKPLDTVWQENSKWLQNLIFEFFLVFFSYIITYNIYYFVFIYNWEAETSHFDPKQGFIFGGVFKSFMDDWLMRDIRYPMLFMGYIYSWLIPAFFNFIGVIHYPKLCFLIILLHTMIIAFTQGPNAAMSIDSMLGGSPSVLILILNIVSCLGAFFNSSMTVENAIAWARFYSLFLSSCIGNILRLLIAFFGVFISQIMVYLFFLYTTSGLGLLWEAKIVNIGDKIKEINAHIGGSSGVGKNYCKAGEDTIGLWKFINEQVEPHFSWIFIYLLMLYIIVKTIATFLNYNGESAKIFLCYFLIILGVTIWLLVTSVFGLGSANADTLTTITVSAPSMFERAKQGVEGLSEYRKRALTNLSNKGNNFLSKTVGQTARNIRNALSDNVISRSILGDDTFTALKPEDKATLREITGYLNEIVTNVDSTDVEETKKVEADIQSLLENNKDIYEVLANIFSQEKIQTFIESRISKGKSMPNILSSMFQYILSRAGANPKVTTMVSTILANMDYGEGLEVPQGPGEEKEEEDEEDDVDVEGINVQIPPKEKE